MFKPGDKVLCIDPSGHEKTKKGEIYTVADVEDTNEGYFVYLEELGCNSNSGVFAKRLAPITEESLYTFERKSVAVLSKNGPYWFIEHSGRTKWVYKDELETA